MITNPKEQKICDEYSARDERGFVHCSECPLRRNIGMWNFQCKANSHYDRKLRDWLYDEEYLPESK